MRELIEIQSKLVAPKNQKNAFGNYNYRNLEGIMEAVKPLLSQLNCTLTFTDELVLLNERIFCKSTAILKNSNGEIESSTSFAELDSHKGMSAEQASGTASSYSRKYAACSLFAIDGGEADPDSLDNRDKGGAPTGARMSFEECNKILNDCETKAAASNRYDAEALRRFFFGKRKWVEEQGGFSGDFLSYLKRDFSKKFAA